MKSIHEMNTVVQEYCDQQFDCNLCTLKDICRCVGGRFENYLAECAMAYNRIVGGVEMNVNDPVNHPSHYTKGKIEVADFIADQKLNFDRGNAVKYVCRAGSKDPEKEIQDLEKAIWYINHEIKTLKGECENGTAEKED